MATTSWKSQKLNPNGSWNIEVEMNICASTQTDLTGRESYSTQTDSTGSGNKSTQTMFSSLPRSLDSNLSTPRKTPKARLFKTDASPLSSISTPTDRSSNLDEYYPITSSDESVKKFDMRQATISMMKERPRHYMGINKSCLFIIGLLQRKTKLSEVKIMMTLRKIRLNEEFQTLGDLFDVNRRTAGKYFRESVPLCAKYLKKFMKCIKPASIKRNLPLSFRRNYKDIGFILDCFEIQIEKSNSPKKQSKSWSTYKSCNTVKYLICVTPDGLISYVSLGYGGRSSDLVITTGCKLQKVLRANLSVMADRGFKGIETVLLQKGSKLFRPPSKTSQQMTKKDVRLTKQIASLRIHVERAISRVRDFNMCKPHVTLDNKLTKYIDHVVKIACGLSNIQQQLIKTN